MISIDRMVQNAIQLGKGSYKVNMKLCTRSRVLICALGIAAAGCTSAYQPATDGSTAKLRLRSSQPAGKDALVYDSEHCTGKRSISADIEGQWIEVTAGRRIWMKRYIDSVGLPFGRYCESLVTFVPEARESYIVDFKIDHSGCSVEVLTVDLNGKETPAPAALPFTDPKCRDD